MGATTSSFVSSADGTPIATYAWADVQDPIGMVQVAHGLAEHAARYERLAQALNAAGFLVFATDHPGSRAQCRGRPGRLRPGGLRWAGLRHG